MVIVKAEANQVEKIVDMSVRAFETDVNDFVKKGYTKYKPYIKEEIYDIMKRKKYKKMTIKQMNWELSFDNLLNYTFVDE